MLTAIRIVLTAAIGIALGLALTWAALQRGGGISVVRAGPWTAAANAGSRDADPYMRASLARRAEIPLGLGEGLSFVASADSKGAVFSPRCDYVVKGEPPASRYWTLSVMTADGRLIDNDAQRYGFTSAEIVRAEGGDFTIVVSRSARPGNWLPVEAQGGFVLVLRLYDTPLAAATATLTARDLPSIARGSCA